MFQIICIVLIAYFEIARELVLKDEKDAKTKSLMFVLEMLTLVCFIASMYVPVYL